MNTPPAPQNSRNRIGIYVEIPGLKMDPLAALRIAGLLTEPIRLALEKEKLLLSPPSVPAAVQDEMLDRYNEMARALKPFLAKQPEAAFMLARARKCLDGIKGPSGVQTFANLNWFLILADVSDNERSLSIIKAELERFDLLELSEIAYFAPGENPGEDRFLTFHPADCVKPFERHYSLLKQLDAYQRNLLKGEAS